MKKEPKIETTKSHSKSLLTVKVQGSKPPLLPEGPLIMICTNSRIVDAGRFGRKIHLDWYDPDTKQTLSQYFPFPTNSSSSNSKIVQTFELAMNRTVTDGEEINFAELIGLKAKVQVETVIPIYTKGALAGTPKATLFHYSKVSELLQIIKRDAPGNKRQSLNGAGVRVGQSHRKKIR